MSFKKKVALVTGASRGIGAEIAKAFLNKGCIVIGTATSEEGIEKIIEMSKMTRGKIYGVIMDVGNIEDIKKTFGYIKTELQGPDIVINNAGITKDNLILRLKRQDWLDVIQTNLNSIFNISQAAIPYMVKKRWGRIINISSVVAYCGNRGQTNYCASKAGIIGFSKSLAQEVAARNITVNVIAPGFITTDMTDKLTKEQKDNIITKIPKKDLGKPKDIANAAVFLASDESDYITGQTIHVNGGMYMA